MPRSNGVDLWSLSDLCTPWCVHVAATLRLAEHIEAGLSGSAELAEAAKCDADSLQRVLRHLVSKGVFEEREPGRFALNEPARALLNPAARLGLNLDGFGGRMAHAWGTLLSAVRTGRPAYHEAFGRPFWDDLQAHPEVSSAFDAMMGPEGHGPPDPEFPLAGGWEAVESVVDVGGGTGALLAAVLRARPGVRGTLVDQPATVARSAEVFSAAGVGDRVDTVCQSFFDPLPAGADVYMLKSVLPDWPDAEAAAILRRCAEAARPAGRVVVLGSVWPDENGPPPPELLMMVLVGGRERSLSEFRTMAHSAGLEVVSTGRQPSGRFVVECRTTA
jgi:SAM-dependent methyltransferase